MGRVGTFGIRSARRKRHRMPISPSRFVITRSRRAVAVERERRQIRRVEIILARDSDQGEQRIAPCIGQRRSHPMRRIGLADRAYRPIR